jgi:hypothetical protein
MGERRVATPHELDPGGPPVGIVVVIGTDLLCSIVLYAILYSAFVYS